MPFRQVQRQVANPIKRNTSPATPQIRNPYKVVVPQIRRNLQRLRQRYMNGIGGKHVESRQPLCGLNKSGLTGENFVAAEAGLKAVARPIADRLRMLWLGYRPAGRLLPLRVTGVGLRTNRYRPPTLVWCSSVLPPLPCTEQTANPLIRLPPALPWHHVRWQLTVADFRPKLVYPLLNHLAKAVQKAISCRWHLSVLILLQSPFYIINIWTHNLF